MPDNHLVKLMQLAVMQQIQEHKYHNPNARVPEDFFASILGDTFTYQKNVMRGGEGRAGVFCVSQSVPNASGVCEWILDPSDERKATILPLEGGGGGEEKGEGGEGGNKMVGKVAEEAQGFYSLGAGRGGEREVNERFDPPMEVTHFPPQPVEKRPPQAWEINWNDDGEAGGEEKEGKEEAREMVKDERAAADEGKAKMDGEGAKEEDKLEEEGEAERRQRA